MSLLKSASSCQFFFIKEIKKILIDSTVTCFLVEFTLPSGRADYFNTISILCANFTYEGFFQVSNHFSHHG